MTLPCITPITNEYVRGVVETENTPTGLILHRLPAWARAQTSDPQLTMAEAQPSGIRLVFTTEATEIALQALPTKRVYTGLPARPDGVVELVVNGKVQQQASISNGDVLHIDMAKGTATHETGTTGFASFAGLEAGIKNIEIWLPHNETLRLVALHSNAPIAPIAAATAQQRRWVHYGSSISQGSNATAPTGIWPAIAAMAGNLDLTNLGFGGGAMLDPFIARILRDRDADLISLKVGINVVNGDIMRRRAFGPALHGFIDTIREKHPNTPLLLISPIHCPIHETTPGPTSFDFAALAQGETRFVATGNPDDVTQGKLSLQIIRDDMSAIVKGRQQTDTNLHYLDGTMLYGAQDFAMHSLPDHLHPDGTSHRLMAERFADLVLGKNGAFAS